MATYTMMLRDIVEHYSQYDTGLTTKQRIEIARPHIFNFDYPFFDEEYRKNFETNFIRHFYMREIGFEVEGLFLFELENWINENIERYNKLFESARLEFDPLQNYKISRLLEREKDNLQNDTRNAEQTSNTKGSNTGKSENNRIGQTNSNSTSTSNENNDGFNRNIESDTPQSRLQLSTNGDGTGIVEYASKIAENKSKNNSVRNDENNVTGNETITDNINTTDNTNVDSNINQLDTFKSDKKEDEKIIETTEGKTGSQSYSELLQAYRNTFISVERIIFKEMNQLFMLIY